MQKWSRPTDTVTGSQKLFGFCTFANGSSALRCKNVLSDIDLTGQCSRSVDVDDLKLQVKAGSKEQAVLESLAEVEYNSDTIVVFDN